MREEKKCVGVLVTGEPVPSARRIVGGFDAMVRRAAGDSCSRGLATIDARAGELPAVEDFAALVVTGSPASVTEQLPWMEAAGRWLVRALDASIPVLGICFGHQLLAHALGGRVVPNPRGREVGTVEAELLLVEDPLLDSTSSSFLVNTTHVDTVGELPPGAVVLARTELDAHAAVRFAPHCWGVQFHPEFDAAILACYLRERRTQLASEGIDVEARLAQLRDAPGCRAVLRRFFRRVDALGTDEARSARV